MGQVVPQGARLRITLLPLTFSPALTDPAALQPVLEDEADGQDLIRCSVQSKPAQRARRPSAGSGGCWST